MLTNVLNLNDSNDGNRIKQGDLSNMRYILTDANNDNLKLNDLPAKVYLTDVTGVKYTYDTTVKQSDNAYVCDVVINQIIPAGTYTLEIWVDNRYVFPSDSKTKIQVTESVIGRQIVNVETHNLWDDILAYGIQNGMIKQDGGSDFVVGPQPPTDKNKIWIDTGVSE
ncbi:hypothetical protein [Staphylococcus warneri]|uniref:hypothetical protein n=1 Tax=Staphylococcus warneri TaxID=1292 RepID=UPI000D1D30A4|nr:hypothetical protein [Staphylococcus warneri]PTI19505.1 hypothetical protein BU082_09385 [Staphylococcus warneri]PTI24409.1 hypothetical protein BU081_06030 [Staphylococcus warneri]RIN00085.1 hypothetical protein BU093_02500 [Staphylococcus warneri]RIN05278.1 hypothetical protein BU092_06440 [Staphylococcus warneri]